MSVLDLKNVDPRVIELYDKLRALGYDIPPTSGYRNPQVNRAAGGARKSQHMRGTAIDIAPRGLDEKGTAKLVEDASRLGFTGIGVYRPGKVHLDIGPRRAWGPSYRNESVPSWARDVVNRHLAGQFTGNTTAAAPRNTAPRPQAKPVQPAMAQQGYTPPAPFNPATPLPQVAVRDIPEPMPVPDAMPQAAPFNPFAGLSPDVPAADGGNPAGGIFNILASLGQQGQPQNDAAMQTAQQAQQARWEWFKNNPNTLANLIG